jgi:apolipoprotein N-acyltransferase
LPPVHAIVLLVPAFIGLLWLIDGSGGWRSAFAAGWWFGFGHFAAGLYWIAHALLTDAAQFGWMVPFAVGGLAAVVAVFPGVAALLVGASGTRGAGRVLVLGAAWTALEWLRGWIFTGFPWNLVGTVWVVSEPMMQSAAVFGVYGISLLSVTVAAMPAVLADGAVVERRALGAVAAAAAVLGLAWAGGAARLALAPGGEVAGVRLRLVQPAIDQKLKWRPKLRRAHVERQLDMSGAPPSPVQAPQPTHVIWAETAVPFDLANEPRLLEALGAAVPAGGLLIAGAPRVTRREGAAARIWNSLHAVGERGEIVATYDKFHLVPFGEYVPFRGLLNISRLVPGRMDFSPGPGPVTLRLPGLPPFSPLICYEAIFPGSVLDREDRPAWLLNVTNDAWFGMSSGPYQHFAAARFRAVEEGLPLVRVANTGISAVVDAHGRTVARLGLGVTGVLDSPLPTALEGITPYGLLGDWIVVMVLLAAAAGGLLLSRGS